MTGTLPEDRKRLFLHYPAGNLIYVIIDVNRHQYFDFSDSTIKPAECFRDYRDACLHISSRYEPRAYHSCSYTFEFDFGQLVPVAEHSTNAYFVVFVEWYVQVGETPDIAVDHKCHSSGFRFKDGSFEPHRGLFGEDCTDEKAEFERRDQRNAAYFELLEREMDSDHSLRTNLDQAIQADDLSLTLRVLASDLSRWGANSNEYLRYHLFCNAKDPKFVDNSYLPEIAPYRYLVPWAVRDIIGSQEAVDRLELRQLPEYARRIKDRFDALNEARRQFANDVTELTLRTRGEDRSGTIAVFHACAHLSQRAITLVRYLEGLAKQLDVVTPAAEVLDNTPIPESVGTNRALLVARPFTGGTIVFERNRVLLCGVDICSDANSSARRIVLNLMARKGLDGKFSGYSGNDLASRINVADPPASMSGFIRDLRNHISLKLRAEARLECGNLDVISTSHRGYHFSDLIAVAEKSQAFHGTEESANVTNVPDEDVPNPSDVPDAAKARADWILSQLAAGVKLKAPMIKKHFNCTVKTAKRDLEKLKDQRKIRYTGSARTGYYELDLPDTDPTASG